MWSSWISKHKTLSNSEFPCHSNASHQWNVPFGKKCRLKIFKYCLGCHTVYWDKMVLTILNLYDAPMPPSKFKLNLTYGSRGYAVLKKLEGSHHGGHLGYRNGTMLAIESLCRPNASHQVSAQSDVAFESRCGLKIFKMAAVAAILDIGTKPLKRFQISIDIGTERL